MGLKTPFRDPALLVVYIMSIAFGATLVSRLFINDGKLTHIPDAL